MKKLTAWVLCLVLFCGFALAEGTDQETIVGCPPAEEVQRTIEMMIEGMSEKVAETLHQGDGFEIWYPSEYLTAGEKYGRDCFYPIGTGEESEIYFMIVPSDADPADAEALLAEATGGFGPDAVISESRWTATENGALLGSVDAALDGVVYRYYLAADEERILLITSCFPQEAAEGFGVRFDRMASTIDFPGIRLNGRREGDGYAIAYPDDLIEPADYYGHDIFYPTGYSGESGIYLLIAQSDAEPEKADNLLNEAIAGYAGYYAVGWGEERLLAGGVSLKYVEVEQEGKIDRYYLIKGDESVYCLTASFPAVGEIDYGACFDAMAETFELENGR